MNDTNQFNDGAGYERLMGRWSQAVAAQFLDWLGPPAKGLRWLDAGCGNGAFTEVLIQRCEPSTITGLDPSEGQIAYARARPGAKIAEFRIGDAQALPFGNNSFDAAAMGLVISFIPDPNKAAAELARVVRPGGLVATYMWDMDDGFPLRPMSVAMASLGLTRGGPPGAVNARRDAMQRIWQGAGLQAVETEVIRITVSYRDFDDFWGSNAVPIGPQGQAIAALSPATKDELRARLRQQLPTDAQGRISYEAFANAVKGRVPG